jgi:hypothetical protein
VGKDGCTQDGGDGFNGVVAAFVDVRDHEMKDAGVVVREAEGLLLRLQETAA